MERIVRLLNKPAIRLIEASLALLFFYLAATKLFGAHEIARLTAIGVGPNRRVFTAMLQVATGVALLVGASGFVMAPVVLTIATTEVLVFQRPPMIAAMCVGTHGFTTWVRHLHDLRAVKEEEAPGRVVPVRVPSIR